MARSFLWSSGGDAASKLAVFATTVVAARALEAVDFAILIALWAASVLAAALWDSGSSTVVAREVAARRVTVGMAAEDALRLRVKTFVLWGGAFLLGVAVLRGVAVPVATLVAFAATSLLTSLRLLAMALLQGHMRFRAIALTLAAGRLVTAVGALLALTVGSEERLVVLASALAAGEAATLLLAALSLLLGHRVREEQPTARSRITFHASFPFALNAVMATAYNRLDVLIVAALSSISQLAAYAPASRLQDALYLVPAALGGIALPYASAHSDQQDELARLLRRLIIGGVCLAIPLAAIVFVFTPEIIEVILGPDYASAVTPTRILVWFLPFAAIGAPLLAGLAAVGRAKDTVAVFGAAFVTALVLQCLLVPWLGATGGAIASLARDPVALVVALWLAHNAGLLGSLRSARACPDR